MHHPGRLLVGTLMLGACASGAEEPALATPSIDTLQSGTIVVTNTGPSAWADTSGWRLVEELVIDPPDGSPGEFSDVTKLVADDAGNVYVMQIMPMAIKKFDARGNWLLDIGREGDGPGEFRDGMLYIHADTLLIQDPNNARITTFLADGTLLGTAPSQCCSFSSALPMMDDGLAMIMGNAPPGEAGARFAYYLTRTDGTVVDTIVRPAPSSGVAALPQWTVARTMDNGTTQSVAIGIPGHPREVRAWRTDRLAVAGNTGRYRLIIQRGYEDTLRVVEAPARQLVLSDSDRDSLFERTIMEQGESWRAPLRQVGKASDIPANRPVWSSLATDRHHRIWVGLPGPGVEVATLEVFSPEGVLLGRLPAPHPNVLEGFWTRDRLYLRDRDADGRPIVRVYRLEATSTQGQSTGEAQ